MKDQIYNDIEAGGSSVIRDESTIDRLSVIVIITMGKKRTLMMMMTMMMVPKAIGRKPLSSSSGI